MKVVLPARVVSPRLREFLRLAGWKVLEVTESQMVFEGQLPVKIPFEIFAITGRRRVYDEINVVGGRKGLYPDGISIVPHRKKRLRLGISEEEYQILKGYARKESISLSEAVRRILLEFLIDWQRAHQEQAEEFG